MTNTRGNTRRTRYCALRLRLTVLLLVGVQPEILEDYGGSLSPVVKQQIPAAMDRVLAYLTEWGIDAESKKPTSCATSGAVEIDEYERLRPSAEEACRYGDGRFL